METTEITEEIPVETDEVTEEIQQSTEEIQDELDNAQEELDEATKEISEKPKVGDKDYTESVKRDMIKLRKRAQKAEQEVLRLNSIIEKSGVNERPQRPSINQFKNEYDEIDYDAYDKAIVDYEDRYFEWKDGKKASEEIQVEAKTEHEENVERYIKQIDELRKDNPDIDKYISKDIFSKDLAYAIYDSPESGKLALYLGKNEMLAKSLSDMSEKQMLKELGKLEERIISLTKNTSQTPRPIIPVDDSTGISEIDESNLSDDEWFKEYKKRRLKKLERG